MNPSDTPAAIGRREAIRRLLLVTGVALAPNLLSAVEQIATEASATAKAQYFNADTFAVVSELAERLLPRTDTPGAKDVGVPAFIDLLYGKCLLEKERKSLEEGLAAFAQACRSARGQEFTVLADADRDAFIGEYLANTPAATGFFKQFRSLTILGYFTSEIVQRDVLIFEPVPGRFDADLTAAEAGTRNRTN